MDLNGQWLFTPDPDQAGLQAGWYEEKTFVGIKSKFSSVTVPSCWQTDPALVKYEGNAWYVREFVIEPGLVNAEGDDIFLHFKGVNYFCTVWLNGTKLGMHEGGFLPFKFKLEPALLQEHNFLAVLVDNIRRREGIPSFATDWFNWAGIHRDVELLVVPKIRFHRVQVKTRVPARNHASIEVVFQQTRAFSFSWELSRFTEPGKVLAQGTEEVGMQGEIPARGQFRLTFDEPDLWSPETPALYLLKLKDDQGNVVNETRFGIREIRVQGSNLFLNRRRVVLRGASLHEELMPHGRTYPREERRNDVLAMKALGFNALRTAHYTHDESLIEICDEEGLLVLEEIPLYWDCDFSSSNTFQLAATMVRDMIRRDINHPSVVMWSVGNEIPVERWECDRFIRRLMDLARHYDDTRLVSYVSCRYWSDTTRKAADITCLNGYFGWYYPTEKQVNAIVEGAYHSNPGVPFFYTEFGAGAKHEYHSPHNSFFEGKFSEERQATVLAHTIRVLNAKPYVAGWFIWIYRDFRSHMRTNQYQQGYNRKGLVSEKNEKKLIARVMPKLVQDRYNNLRQVFWTMKFFQKVFFPAAKLVAIIAGIISRLVTHKAADIYYDPRPPS